MFNHELKEKFIKEFTTSLNVRNACVSIFNVFEKYENNWNADLCTKEAKDLQPIVEESVGMRSKSKKLRINILRDYVKWCINNNIPGACDGMLHVNTTGFETEKMRQQTVTSPLHLQMCLNQIFEPEYEETSDNIYRCFCWLAYAGVEENDILNIRTSDVDFLNMVVKYKGEEFPIYRESIPTFKNCVNLVYFQYKHPNYSAKTIFRARVGGDILIRGIKSTPTILSMRVILSRRYKKYLNNHEVGMKLSYSRIWISGLFYRMYERERAGLPVDFSEAASRFMEGRTYKLESGRNTLESYQRRVAREYLLDYEYWKSTFS